MATTEERLKILKMIQEGKITAEQGAQLLEALEERKSGAAQGGSPGTGAAASAKSAKWFHVRVTDTNSGKPRVNVRLPIGLVTSGFKMGARFSPEVEGLDPNQLLLMINNGEIGQVVDVYDPEDGEHVEVFLE